MALPRRWVVELVLQLSNLAGRCNRSGLAAERAIGALSERIAGLVDPPIEGEEVSALHHERIGDHALAADYRKQVAKIRARQASGPETPEQLLEEIRALSPERRALVLASLETEVARA